MNTTLQTITSPHTGSSKIAPPTSSWRGLFRMSFKHLAVQVIMLTVGIESVLAQDTFFPSGNGDGSSSKPFQITNASELQAFGSMYQDHPDLWTSTYYNKCYKLTANIQLDTSVDNNYIPAGDTNAGNDYGKYFQGTFDGNNKTISGIRHNDSKKAIGLISSCKDGIIKDLTLQDCSFQTSYGGGYNSIGGAIAGYIRNGTIDNCTVINCVIGGNNNGNQGGIVGMPSYSTVTNCWVKGTTSINGRGGAIFGSTMDTTYSNNYYEWTVKRNGNDVPYNGTGWGIMSGPQDVSGKAQIEPVNSWAALKRAMSVGVTGSGVITLSANCTDGIKDNDSYLHVPSGKTVVLDLNGFTINRNLPSSGISERSVILNNGTLTIKDTSTGTPGSITGGVNCGINNSGSNAYLTIKGGRIAGNNGKGIDNVSSAHLTIDGGSITGNSTRGIESRASLTINGGSITGNAGGITIYGGSATINDGIINNNHSGSGWNGGGILISSGSLTIIDGSITGNSAGANGGGVYVNYGCTLTINGGSITGNSASSNGGGIFINYDSYSQHGTLKIGGDCTIYDNLKGENQNNVYLPNGNSKVQITENLNDAIIGITAVGAIPRVITSNSNGKTIAASNFISDNASYGISIVEGNAYLKNVVPQISMDGWTYGGEASSPILEGYTDSYENNVTFTYKAEGASDFSGDKPIVAGTHTVKATVVESENYIEGVATNTYTVDKREVSLTWDNTSLTYNKSAQKPTASVSNKVGTDVCDVTVSGEQTNASDVAYTATASALTGTHSANYKLPTTLPTQTFTIGKKDIIVSGITASDKTYDGNTTATIVATNASFDGLLDGDALSVSTSGTFADANVGTGKTVTFGALTLGGTSVGNYQLKTGEGVQQSSTTADITTKALTITADGKNITYGDEPPTYTVSSDGFVAGESEANLTGTISCTCDYAQYNNANTYLITPSGATSTNYAITYTPGTLTVGQKILSVTANAQTITYGEDITSATTDVTTVGLVGSDALNSITLTKTKTDYNASAYANDITPSEAIVKRGETNVTGNYNITYNKGNLTINQKALSITASAQTITYGENISSETTDVSVEGLVTGDALNSITLTKTQTNYSATAYANDITPSAAVVKKSSTDVTDNYNITYNNGDLTINKKTIGLNWSTTPFDYDGTAKAPTATATDLEAGDECNVTVNVPGEHTAVGFYTATATSLSNTNYALPTSTTKDYEIVRPMTDIAFSASKHWNTYCAFEDLATPDGITAYIVTGTNGGKATTSQIDFIPQGVGVLLYGEAGSDLRASAYTGAAGSFTNNKLVGVTAATTIAAEAGYVLYGDAFVLTTGGTLPANRSYLPASGPALTRSIIIEGGDGATSIESIEDHQATDGHWFNMQGRRIDKPKKKGLYILDGKKVVIK